MTNSQDIQSLINSATSNLDHLVSTIRILLYRSRARLQLLISTGANQTASKRRGVVTEVEGMCTLVSSLSATAIDIARTTSAAIASYAGDSQGSDSSSSPNDLPAEARKAVDFLQHLELSLDRINAQNVGNLVLIRSAVQRHEAVYEAAAMLDQLIARLRLR